jgi:hypothetical protein
MWAIRLSRSAPKHLLSLAAAAGLLASARFALAPPSRTVRVVSSSRPALADRGAEGLAVLFARRYLTWQAGDGEANKVALERFAGAGVEPDFGLELPSSGGESVAWAEVVRASEPEAGLHTYVVAAQTDSDGLVYLAVRVTQSPGGALALAGYPAFVGVPRSVPDEARRPLTEVRQPALVPVVERTLESYLAGSTVGSETEAASPDQHLSLSSMQRPYWMRPGVVWAVIQARDRRGVQYTLGYELEAVEARGRWRITSIQPGART